MKKSRLSRKGLGIKALLCVAITAVFAAGCDQERPVIIVNQEPEEIPVIKQMFTMMPDTISLMDTDSTMVWLRTIPYNLFTMDSLSTLEVTDSTGAPYPYAEIKHISLRPDSLWNIMVGLKQGWKTGHAFNIMFANSDTVMFSNLMVLKNVPKHYEINLAGSNTAAWIQGEYPTLRVRTVPWDAIQKDSAKIAIVDTAGHGALPIYSMQGLNFIQEDSTWEFKLRMRSASNMKDTMYMALRLELKDQYVLSEPVILRKVDLTLNSVTLGNGKTMTFDSNTNTFKYALPKVTDRFNSQTMKFAHKGDMICLGDSVLNDTVNHSLDFSNGPVTVSVWAGGLHKDYRISVMSSTGLPVVRINTGKRSITRRDTWVDNLTMSIELADGTLDYNDTLSIKGRGNGTWTEPEQHPKYRNGTVKYAKKPYALKLNKKAKILGMHKSKRWILLANFKDRTLLRNEGAYWLSRQTEFPYTVSGQFVELVWNDVHIGNYYLCEQARIDNNRIDIKEPDLVNPADGGFYMEIDTYYNYGQENSQWADKGTDLGFWSSRFNLPYIFKDPDSDENGNALTKSSASYKYMYNFVANMETAIFNASSVNHDYEKYLDVDRAIDFALIQEITMNHDSYNTWPKDGPHSAFLYMDSCGKMCFGPAWDFDYNTFMPTCKVNKPGSSWWNAEQVDLATEWQILSLSAKTTSGKYYFSYLLKDKKFKKRMVERWDMYKNVWKAGFTQHIDMMADSIRASEAANWKIWGSNYPNDINPNGDQNQDLTLSFKDAVKKMETGFTNRWNWMNTKMEAFRKEVADYTE